MSGRLPYDPVRPNANPSSNPNKTRLYVPSSKSANEYFDILTMLGRLYTTVQAGVQIEASFSFQEINVLVIIFVCYGQGTVSTVRLIRRKHDAGRETEAIANYLDDERRNYGVLAEWSVSNIG